MFKKDIRISQIRDIVECMVGKKREVLEQTYVLLKTNNDVIIIQDNTVIYSTKLRDIPDGISLAPIGFRYSDIMDIEDRDLYIPNNSVVYNVWNIADAYNNIINDYSNLIYAEDNLKENPTFADLLNLKTAQGLKFYNINANGKIYMVPMFTGLMSISKPDNVSIKLYRIDDEFSVVDFIIFKKRINNTVHLVFRILNLINL